MIAMTVTLTLEMGALINALSRQASLALKVTFRRQMFVLRYVEMV